MPRKSPNKIDKIVGRNIRLGRLAKGLSQTELGRSIGVTFQQVQKYEKGTNRVGSGRLFQIAAVLDVDIKALFEGSEFPEHSNEHSMMDIMSEPQSFRLVQAFAEIGNPALRRSVVSLVESLAHSGKSGN
jgi:transcriptional regulator with XRE-family HTH domain